MPYYVYRIVPPRELEHIDTRDKYQEARSLVRERRAQMGPEDRFSVRMIFAGSQAEAEKILLTPRDERVIGED